MTLGTPARSQRNGPARAAGEPGGPGEPEAYDPQWRRTFIALCACQCVAMVAFGMSTPFLPLYVSRLGVEDPRAAAGWAGAMSAGGMLVMAAMAPVWGSIADRYGRKPMVTRALFGGGLVVATMSFARSPEQLFALRLVQGAFSGTVSAARTLVAGVAPASELGFALGMMSTAAFVGNSAGPFIGGLLADQFGFGVSFMATGLLLLLTGIAVNLLVKERFERPAPGEARSAGVTGGLRLVWGTPGLAALIGTLFFVQAGMSAVTPVLPLFVGSLLPAGDPVATVAGAVLGVTAITSAVAAGFAGKLGDRVGHARVIGSCSILGGLLYLPQALVTSAWQLVALRAGLGVVTGGLMPGAMALIALRTPPARRGWVFGLTATATALGSAAGPAAGAAAASVFGLRGAFVLTALVLTGAGVWVTLALQNTPRRRQSPPEE